MAMAVMDEAARRGVSVRAAADLILFAPPPFSTAVEINEISDRFRAAYEAVIGAELASRSSHVR